MIASHFFSQQTKTIGFVYNESKLDTKPEIKRKSVSPYAQNSLISWLIN
jgi:hypothetical protein